MENAFAVPSLIGLFNPGWFMAWGGDADLFFYSSDLHHSRFLPLASTTTPQPFFQKTLERAQFRSWGRSATQGAGGGCKMFPFSGCNRSGPCCGRPAHGLGSASFV